MKSTLKLTTLGLLISSIISSYAEEYTIKVEVGKDAIVVKEKNEIPNITWTQTTPVVKELNRTVKECSEWLPEIGLRTTNQIFNQTSNCKEVVETSTTQREISSTGIIRNVGSPLIETHETPYQDEREVRYTVSNWTLTERLFVNCQIWNSYPSERPIGVSFAQYGTNCSKEEAKYGSYEIYKDSILVDASELSSEIEKRTTAETYNINRMVTGTNPDVTCKYSTQDPYTYIIKRKATGLVEVRWDSPSTSPLIHNGAESRSYSTTGYRYYHGDVRADTSDRINYEVCRLKI